MIVANTPIEDHRERWGLYVKREDLSCPAPGPSFSKARGVWSHLEKRPENLIGVLDTYHSRAGWAVAQACRTLGKRCTNFYPEYKYEPGPRVAQNHARDLGAVLYNLPAGRSAVLFHQAKRVIEAEGGYMMPNALKLDESVEETAKEVHDIPEGVNTVIIPVSSATIAAGVIKGWPTGVGVKSATFLLHMGYHRSPETLRQYLIEKAGMVVDFHQVLLVDEGYEYKDRARPGPTPEWPCSPYYDLKAFRWAQMQRAAGTLPPNTLFWNVG